MYITNSAFNNINTAKQILNDADLSMFGMVPLTNTKFVAKVVYYGRFDECVTNHVIIDILEGKSTGKDKRITLANGEEIALFKAAVRAARGETE